MAEAMLRGGACAAANISVTSVIDPNAARGKVLAELGLSTSANFAGFAGNFDVVVLAIKPQTFDAVAAELRERLLPEQLVVSIMAGVPLAKLSSALGGHAHVVRAMPNTPAAIGAGMTVWCAGAELSVPHAATTASLLGSFGAQLRADKEDYLDMATALSGTGPAWVHRPRFWLL